MSFKHIQVSALLARARCNGGNTYTINAIRTSRGYDPYENLANAIIAESVKEFKLACKHIAQNKNVEQEEITKREIISFFKSDFYDRITELPREVIINYLNDYEANY